MRSVLREICQDFLKNHSLNPMSHQDINSPDNIGALKSKQVIRNCKFWTDKCFVPNSLNYCIRTETCCRQSKKACVKLSTTSTSIKRNVASINIYVLNRSLSYLSLNLTILLEQTLLLFLRYSKVVKKIKSVWYSMLSNNHENSCYISGKWLP